MVGAGDVVQQTELKVQVFLEGMLGDYAVLVLVDLVGAVDFQQLAQHMIQFFPVAGVALHGVLEGVHYEENLSF